jgi:hypothetical protein
MPNDAEPTQCPECGHLVYRPLVAPVHHAQQSCRAVLSGTAVDADRCGCPNAVHRMPTLRPRHRQEAVSAAS